MATVRVRPKARVTEVLGWHIDFKHGPKYRFIRPDAAAEIVGIEIEAKRLIMRQPDAWELEDMKEGQVLHEKGQWRIKRVLVKLEGFA